MVKFYFYIIPTGELIYISHPSAVMLTVTRDSSIYCYSFSNTIIHNVATIIFAMSFEDARCSFSFTFWMTFLIVEWAIPSSSETSS